MAKYYRARQDVSVPRVVSQEDGEAEVTEGVNYAAGSLVREQDMTARHRKLAENGELDHLLMPIDEEMASTLVIGGGEPEFGIFIAEHEAEAHALEAYGHQVVPQDQALEAMSVSAEHAKQYQQAVKDAGLDRRPAQEYMAQERERVPDEFLLGAEHRSGLPFDRSAGIQASGGEEEGGESEQDGSTRPAPGSDSGNQNEESSNQGE